MSHFVLHYTHMKHATIGNMMAGSTTLTIRIDQEIKDRLEVSAKRQKRSKAFLAVEAIEEYLSTQEWQQKRIVEALASVERGEGVSHDTVMTWIESWDSENELPVPKS